MADIDLSGIAASHGRSQPLRAALVRPPGSGPWPGVVMIHEAFGLDEVMRRQAERLAAAGYLALAVDLFSDGGTLRCLVPTLRAMRKGQGRPFADIQAARGWLAASSDCTGKVGVIGFCMGGGFALLTAARGFDAASSNYGIVPGEDALRGACPVVGSYGARDPELRGGAAKLEGRLRAVGVEHDVKEYPGAGHSFLNRPNLGPAAPLLRVAGIGYHAPSAEDAWARILPFFDEHLR
jgi:carboxymethylenebutenolidase